MALRYSNMVLSISNRKVKQVSIKSAEKAYNDGKQLWLHPCNMRVNNPCQSPMPLNKADVDNNAFTSGSSFSAMVNDYKHYNCDNERGKYPIFFVEVE